MSQSLYTPNNGKPFNYDPPAILAPTDPQDTLDALARLDELVTNTRNNLGE